MRYKSPFPVFIITVFIAACGCVAAEAHSHDVSLKAYEEEMATFKKQGFPILSYADWKLFQEQHKLTKLYFDLLDIDPKTVRADVEKDMHAYDDYLREQGVIKDTEFGIDIEEDNKLYIKYLKGKKPIATVTAASLLGVYERWAAFKYAEEYFRNNMIVAGVPPEDALKALQLSNRTRRPIGQWEQAFRQKFEWADKPGQPDKIASKKAEIKQKRAEAAAVLKSFHPATKETPLSQNLVKSAREEIENSVTAETRKQWECALQWALDAAVTARSAKALYDLERRSP